MTITNSTAIALRLADAGPATFEKYIAEETVNRLKEFESTINQILCENAAFTHNDKTLEENLDVTTSCLNDVGYMEYDQMKADRAHLEIITSQRG